MASRAERREEIATAIFAAGVGGTAGLVMMQPDTAQMTKMASGAVKAADLLLKELDRVEEADTGRPARDRAL
jgi:hypothetical protein